MNSPHDMDGTALAPRGEDPTSAYAWASSPLGDPTDGSAALPNGHEFPPGPITPAARAKSIDKVLVAAGLIGVIGAGSALGIVLFAGSPQPQAVAVAPGSAAAASTFAALAPVPAAAVAAPPAPAPDAPLPAYASAVDGHGERAVWIPRVVPGRGVEIAQAVLSDVRGRVELQLGLLGRKEWRAFARDILARGAAMGVAELDRGRAHALVAAARARNELTGQRVPEGADLWLAQLGPAAAPPDPAARFAPLPPDEEREALAASGKLHELPLLRGWLADEAHLRTVAQRLDEVMVSPLYVDERQRAEQLERVVAEAAESWLDADRRSVLAARLFAVAEHLLDSGDAARASSAAAAARALAAGRPAAEIPFARQLVEKAFPPPPPPAEPPAPPAEPLIVAPR